eukprot:6932463-Alexandrium_andersonii.AAC.1
MHGQARDKEKGQAVGFGGFCFEHRIVRSAQHFRCQPGHPGHLLGTGFRALVPRMQLRSAVVEGRQKRIVRLGLAKCPDASAKECPNGTLRPAVQGP